MFKKKISACCTKKWRGFSTIELIVTIAILAVLIAVLTPALIVYTERARTQTDVSATNELTNAVKIAMAYEEVYDELIQHSEFNNVSCYIDTPSEADHLDKKIELSYGQYSFNDMARTKDETPYYAAGNMRGVTITFEPNINSKGSTYVLDDAIINKFISADNKRLSDLQYLCGKLRSVIGNELKQQSKTYRYSEYTIFIYVGYEFEYVDVYGQYNGTNLTKDDKTDPDDTTTDRVISDTGDDGEISIINDDQCAHITNIINTIEATCTTEGYSGDRVCLNCGKCIVLGEILPVADHEEKVVNQITATCTTVGYTGDTVCKWCGLLLNPGQETPIGEHVIAILASVSPTCEKDGSTESKICENCGIVIEAANTIPHTGHNYKSASWKWNDVESAKATIVCETCGHDEEINAIITTNVIAGTCESSGEISYTATVTIGDKEFVDTKKKTVDAVGHIAGANATCTTPQTCDVCGTTIKDALGHVSVNGGTEKVHKKCSACGITLVSSHIYSPSIYAEATCITKGSTKYTCACGYNFVDQNIAIDPDNHVGSPAHGGTKDIHSKYSCCGITINDDHDYISIVAKEPTCEETGIRKYTCGCGYSYTESMAITNHNSVYGGIYDVHTKCGTCGITLSSTHNYTSKITTEATCKVEGVKTHTCDCGYSYTDAIEKTSHIEVNGGTNNVHKKCSVCGTTLSSAHVYLATVSEVATCTTNGTKEYLCSCGYSYTENIAATGHTTVNGGTKDAHTKCNVCGATISKSHSYSSTVSTAATCTTNGIRKYTCGCGYSYTESILSTGHTSVNGGTSGVHTKCSTCGTTISSTHSYTNKVTTAATCVKDGVRTYTCGCGYSYTETIVKTGHTEVNGGTNGIHKKCSVCGTTLSTAHIYTQAVSVAATCTTKGTTKYTCACGYSYTDQNIAINANNHTGSSVNGGTLNVHAKYSCCGATISSTHSYTNKVTTAATCTTDGVRTYTCGCGYSYTEAIAKNGHTEVNGGTSTVHKKCSVCGTTLSSGHVYTSTITVEATCTTKGTTKYTCACGYNYTDQNIAINANNHTGSSVNGGTALVHTKYSCCGAAISTTHNMTTVATADQCKKCACGYIDTTHISTNGGLAGIHTKCSACGYTISSTHSYTSSVTTAATCTTAGVRTYTCTCKYSYTEAIPATGHTEVNGGTSSIHKKCSVCGVTTATTHTYTTTVSVAATCTTKGTTKYTCSCGYSYTEQNIAINSSNHNGSSVNGGTETVHTKYSCCGATISSTHSYTNVKTSAQCRTCACGYTDTTHTSVNGGTSSAHTKCSDCGYVISTSHSYSSSTTSYATCTSTGTRKYTCSCGYYYTSSYGPNGHSYSSSITTSATCTTNGIRTYSCSNCSSSYTESITATGHNPGSAATCTTAQTCTKCNATITPATGHDYSAATCTTAKTCSKCGATSGTITGHTWVAATCTEPKTCSRCGETSGTKLGHSYSAATCTTLQTCSKCGKTKGELASHSYSDATCTSPKTCKNCGATSGSKLGHNYSAATCTKPKTCTRCSATSGSALGHTAGAAATCGTAQTCTRCSYVYQAALGHRWVTKDGKTTCNRCGITKVT